MIVVTAPTGQIAGRLVDLLLTADEPAAESAAEHAAEPVRVIVRDPARLDPSVRERVEVVTGSHDDPAVVDEALRGADALFWLVPADPRTYDVDGYVAFSRAGAAAITEHRVGHVVVVSALGRGTPWVDRAGLVTGSLAMVDQLARTGAAVRSLALPGFMDNTLRDIPAIKHAGVVSSPIAPDRRLPMVATRDIADVAARVLLDRGWTGVDEVPVLGPEDLSPTEMARTVADVLGVPVEYRQSTGEEQRAAMVGYGASAPFADAMVDMMLAKDAGLDLGVVRTPGNSTPTTYRQWCTEVLRPAFAAAA